MGTWRPGLRATEGGRNRHELAYIGQGEVPWDDFYRTLREVGFDGIMTACVFAWEEKADESGRFMRSEMQRYVDKFWGEK